MLRVGDRVRPDMNARHPEDPQFSAWDSKYSEKISKSTGTIESRNEYGIYVRWDKDSHWANHTVYGPYRDDNLLLIDNGLETMLKVAFGE